MAETVYHFDGVRLDLARGELSIDGVAVLCQPLVLTLLARLCESPNTLVTREQCFAELWPEQRFVSDESLTKAAQRARQALGPYGAKVVTVRKRGLRLDAAVVAAPVAGLPRQASANDLETAPCRVEAPVPSSDWKGPVWTGPDRRRKEVAGLRHGLHRGGRLAAALALLALAGIAVASFSLQPPRPIDPGVGLLASDLEGEPALVVDLVRKGVAASLAGRRGESIVLFQAAHARARSSALPILLAARGEIAGAHEAEAQVSLAAARERLAAHPDAYGLVLERYFASQLDGPAAAQASATALLAVRPGAFHARLALAHLHLQRWEREAALYQLQQIEPSPRLGRAAALVAADRGSLGDRAGARAFLAQLDLDSAARAYALGRLAWTSGDLDAALKHFDQGASDGALAEQPEVAIENQVLGAVVAAEAGRDDALDRLRGAEQRARERRGPGLVAELLGLEADLAGRRGDLRRRDAAWAEVRELTLSPADQIAVALTAPLVGAIPPLLGTGPGAPADAFAAYFAELPVCAGARPLLAAAQALAAGDPARAREALAAAEREGILACPSYREYVFAYHHRLGDAVAEPCRVDPPFPNLLRFAACREANAPAVLFLATPAR